FSRDWSSDVCSSDLADAADLGELLVRVAEELAHELAQVTLAPAERRGDLPVGLGRVPHRENLAVHIERERLPLGLLRTPAKREQADRLLGDLVGSHQDR